MKSNKNDLKSNPNSLPLRESTTLHTAESFSDTKKKIPHHFVEFSTISFVALIELGMGERDEPLVLRQRTNRVGKEVNKKSRQIGKNK